MEKNYKMLKRGDIIQLGDEYLCDFGWMPTEWAGACVPKTSSYRRPLLEEKANPDNPHYIFLQPEDVYNPKRPNEKVGNRVKDLEEKLAKI